ncbi:MAG: GIY-YIG nuclease family protein, partial [Sedimentisphaerales bacterium]|nr:GIY-YIG nuclease family protein [Sedimentisphaerales bacterium]
MGKSIRIFLVDGQPYGLLTAEIMNWIGKVIVAPRAQLAKLAERNDVRRTGTYLLVGPSPNVINRDCVYVGESDNVLSRIVDDHEKTKDFWVKAVLILSKDENLTKAHVRYLESRLIQMIQLSGRAELTNGTSPPLPLLPEADVSDMEYFLEQLKIILPVLGMNFTQPKPQITEEHDEEHEDISP